MEMYAASDKPRFNRTRPAVVDALVHDAFSDEDDVFQVEGILLLFKRELGGARRREMNWIRLH
jgi:hypothetical protein